MHTKESLQRDLDVLGLRPSDTLLVHSSMKKIGPVDGGAETVRDALIDYFSPAGLIVFPTLSYTLMHSHDPERQRCRDCGGKPPKCLAQGYAADDTRVFNVRETPACVGLLPNLFMQRPGAVRSLHWSHSLAAAGADAAAFTAGHERFATPCDAASPWGRLRDRDAKILMIGTTLTTCTYFHGVCEWARPANQPYEAKAAEVVDYDGRTIAAPDRLFNTTGKSVYYPKIESELEVGGALGRGKFGDAESLLIACRAAAEIGLARLRAQPELFDVE